MPVRTRNIQDLRADDARFRTLRDRLISEWRGQGGDPPAPDIEEQTDARGRVVHLLVTWDAWSDLDAQTRSEIIVDAFQAVRGAEAIVDLSLAMGVTSAEARRLAGAAAAP